MIILLVSLALAALIAVIVFLEISEWDYSMKSVACVAGLTVALLVGTSIVTWLLSNSMGAHTIEYLSLSWIALGGVIQMFAATQTRSKGNTVSKPKDTTRELKDILTFTGWMVITCGSVLAFWGVS